MTNRHDFNCAIGTPVFLANGLTFHRGGLSVRVVFPERYGIDKSGRRVLVGLSVQETFEFETLDDIAPSYESGAHIAWRDGVPITSREKRWLELYQKHDEAWKLLSEKTID